MISKTVAQVCSKHKWGVILSKCCGGREYSLLRGIEVMTLDRWREENVLLTPGSSVN